MVKDDRLAPPRLGGRGCLGAVAALRGYLRDPSARIQEERTQGSFRGMGLLWPIFVAEVEGDCRLRLVFVVVLRGSVGRRRLAVAGYWERSLLVFVVVALDTVDRDILVAGCWEDALMVAVAGGPVPGHGHGHRRR